MLVPAEGALVNEDLLATFSLLAGVKETIVQSSYAAEKGTPTSLTPLGAIYMPLEGLIDMDAEKNRVGKEISKVEDELKKSKGKLSNPAFADKAPEAVVNTERERLAEWESKLAQLQEMLAALG